jgi:serine/threonine-protein kinase
MIGESLPFDLAATLDARLRTLDAGTRATIARNPRATITPERATPGPAQRRAVELLEQIAAEMPVARGLELGGTLGEGGMGVVRLAVQRSVGRQVAVKTLKDGAQEPHGVSKILREGWITGQLEHPNIVPVYDVAMSAEGRPIIVLKRIEGRTWSELISDAAGVAERFGVDDVLEWNLRTLMQVCNAVHFAHSRHIIHRDLKPENVMIGEFGEVYVVDWGIAVSVVDDGSGRLPLASEQGGLAGTPCYMAPEMIAAEIGELGAHTDVYLLGAILYEILTGRPPHLGDDPTVIFSSVLLSEPPLDPELPVELTKICRRAMARLPADRFESAEALRLAIQDYLQHAGATRLAALAGQRLSELKAEIAQGASSDEQRRRLYDLLGECRFGFRSAAQAWPEHVQAQAGLVDALSAMAEYELSRDDPEAAELLVRELPSIPAALEARIRESRRAKAERAAKDEALRKVGESFDPEIGRRTRTFVGVALGAIWTIAPLISYFVTEGARSVTPMRALVLDLCITGIVVGFVLWARDSLSKSALNRRFTATVVFTWVAKTVFDAWQQQQGRSAQQTLVLSCFLFFVVATLTAINLHTCLLFAAGAYLVAFIASTASPAHVLLWLAGANATLTLCIAWMWRMDGVRRMTRD